MYTPSFAFRRFPPNSARIGYVTERGAVYYGGLLESKDNNNKNNNNKSMCT